MDVLIFFLIEPCFTYFIDLLIQVPKKEKLLTGVMSNLSQALAQLKGTLILRTMDVSC